MPHYFQTMTKYTLILINLEQFPAEFASYLEENIIDVGMKHELENRKIINWCRTVKPLFPLKTRGRVNIYLIVPSYYINTNIYRVRTALENPGEPLNLKIKIQALENPGI